MSKLVVRKSYEVEELNKQLEPFKFLLDNLPPEVKTQWFAGVKKQDAIWRKKLRK